MKLSLHKILILGLCLFIGACAFKKEDAEDKQRQELAEDVAKQMQEDQKNAGVDLRDSNVQIGFEPNEAGYYNINIVWPESVGRMEVYFNDNFRKSISERNTYSEIVRNGDSIKVILRAYASISNGGRLLAEHESSVVVPLDILINSVVELSKSESWKAERIFFGDSGQIVTNGFNLTIDVKNFIVLDQVTATNGRPEDYSKIVTYKSSTTKSTSFNSNLEIFANSAQGKLSVALIGQNGQTGRDAKDFTEKFDPIAKPGTNGTPGEVRSRKTKCIGPDRGGCGSELECLKNPTDGGTGSDGIDGTNGEAGQKGGATGNLKIQIKNSDNFAITVFQRPGVGGKGGLGNLGQQGGPGGLAGHTSNACPKAQNGLPGSNGKNGVDGKDGACGEWGEVISNVKVTIPEKEINPLCLRHTIE